MVDEMKRSVWVGLTGGIGSGKSQVANILRDLGVPIIDADQVARQMTSQANSLALQKIQAEFGEAILDFSGSLNRNKMRELIFADSTARKRLENILHPLMIEKIRQEQQAISCVYGIVELPTLAEHPHFQTLIHHVLLVCADEQTRIERVKQRNSFDEAAIRAIMAAQADENTRMKLADSVIENNDSLATLQRTVRAWHQRQIAIWTNNMDEKEDRAIF